MTAIKQVRKAVIPAAGLGTRFLPATKATPKEMLPIVDKPTIQYIIEEALASGIEDILIITGRSKRAIEDHFDRSIELELNLAAVKRRSWRWSKRSLISGSTISARKSRADWGMLFYARSSLSAMSLLRCFWATM
jgi:UTP-glucose-1-phosphate uridylyltransferase